MKLVRFGNHGQEKPGVIDCSGIIRDVSSFVDDWYGKTLSPENLQKLAGIPLESFPAAPENTRLAAPMDRVGKIVGCALTYGKHAAEAGLDVPTEPMFLLSAPSAINGPFDNVIMPRNATKLDWEVELGVVFGKAGSYIAERDAMDYVAGFCVANDVSERVFQLERGTQWTKGKSADTLKPLGPWLVTPDEVGDPNNLSISLDVNGQTMQRSNTSDMVFSIAQLISRVSEYLSWKPGDVMITGTPAGVGYGMDPQVYLKPGDVMEARIEKLGAQRSVVQAFMSATSEPNKV
ncbi:MAG: 2-keto-4-pentenoate hydratase/2-oxohepta-3-ene-1,7-dioic acid hydratase in catechol pathway [Polaribacter sp.]|jgi:2-keto-4-pentenoate hydratase/2-oxohepta-3-ene-1,7-dioic acid hydratase in catechol pathway